MESNRNVGFVGTGFIIKEAFRIVQQNADIKVSKILTRRKLDEVTGLHREYLTNSIDELIDSCDVVFESTGDPIYATEVIEKSLIAGRKVVTMNAELHVTTGSYLAGLGYLSEADGDQPGATALLRREALDMGFNPLVYSNIKGYINHNPSLEDMKYWSKRQQLSLAETTSFTDGTKLQIEQALCANAFDATIAKDGLIGGEVDNIFDSDHLVDAARQTGSPICDYVLCPDAPPGVYLLAEHPAHKDLPHYGPYKKLRTTGDQAYLLLRPYHLCGMEVSKSLNAVFDGAPPLLNNGYTPKVSIAAIAKSELGAGLQINEAIGSFDFRGEAVLTKNNIEHVPFCLLSGARLKRSVAPGQKITFDDVEVPESRALDIWLNELRPRALSSKEL